MKFNLYLTLKSNEGTREVPNEKNPYVCNDFDTLIWKMPDLLPLVTQLRERGLQAVGLRVIEEEQAVESDIERIQMPDGQVYRRAAIRELTELEKNAPYESTEGVSIGFISEAKYGITDPDAKIHPVT